MRAKIVGYEGSGLVLKWLFGGRFTVAYGEILTVERVASGRGLRLHTRTAQPVRIGCRGRARVEVENELRCRGVRVVDRYGAIIAPTLLDFEEELAREPVRVRQSSDNA